MSQETLTSVNMWRRVNILSVYPMNQFKVFSDDSIALYHESHAFQEEVLCIAWLPMYQEK